MTFGDLVTLGDAVDRSRNSLHGKALDDLTLLSEAGARNLSHGQDFGRLWATRVSCAFFLQFANEPYTHDCVKKSRDGLKEGY